MSDNAGNSRVHDLQGVLRFNEFEGGFWSIELDESHDEIGAAAVLEGWSPGADGRPSDLADGARVRARVRVREEQFGFLMAGTYADVVEITAA